MQIHSMFRTFVALITMLTLSSPFSVLAQQDSVWIAVETAAAQDANVVHLAAKAAAEKDASGDINKLLWFGVGAGICCIGGAVGALTGCFVGNLIDPIRIEPTAASGFGPYPVPDISNGEGVVIGSCIGFVAGVLVPFIGVYYSYQGNPPSDRLLGKSPEYIEVYTNAYKTKTRSLRTIWAAAGATTAGGGLCLLGYIQ